jgi:septation ring formation regulator EzrA
MGRRKVPEDLALHHEIKTRVNTRKYQELQRILRQNPNKDMSSLLRDFLNDRPVKVFTHDLTLDNLMEELAKVRMEIKAIGVNINQITRLFNTYPETRRKEIYARMAFAEHRALEPKIDQLLTIISKLAKKWLSK